jgi:hypothetical protein
MIKMTYDLALMSSSMASAARGDVLSPFYYKTSLIRCLGLHFSDCTVRLIEILEKKSNQVV